jgi:hypothetical protein
MDAMASQMIGARASPGPRANRISPCCLSIAIKRLRYRARARQGVLDGGSQKLTLSGKIAARIFAEERQKEAARQAAPAAPCDQRELERLASTRLDSLPCQTAANLLRCCLRSRRKVQAHGRAWACGRRLAAPTKGTASLRRQDAQRDHLPGQGRAREKALPLPRRALNRTSNARGQGAHRGGAAQTVGRVVRDVVG